MDRDHEFVAGLGGWADPWGVPFAGVAKDSMARYICRGVRREESLIDKDRSRPDKYAGQLALTTPSGLDGKSPASTSIGVW